MQKVIYMGSQTDGYEYWQVIGNSTGGGLMYMRMVGDFYLTPIGGWKDGREFGHTHSIQEKRKEYFPFLESL